MKNLGRKYPEYDNMNEQELNNESDRLLNDHLKLLRDPSSLEVNFKDIEDRNAYINQIKMNRDIRSAIETTFTDNNDDKTVSIKKGADLSAVVLSPNVFLPEEPENEKNIFHWKLYKKKLMEILSLI